MDELFSENNLLDCPIKTMFHVDCLGCGLQRSFVLLVQGNILDSIIMYPALIPMIIMFAYLLAHVYFNFRNGARLLKYFYFLNIILIVANYLIKQIL